MHALVFLALGLVALASAPHAAVRERPNVTPFERGHRDIVLAAWLNGRGPFRFLLDTGSTHTAVSSRTAEAIGAAVVAKATMGSAAGSSETLVVDVNSIEVGPVTVSNILASVIDLAELPGGNTIDGVIGHDVLGSLRYTIDFRQRRVVWSPSGAMDARGSSLELQVSGGRFLIALPQRQSLVRLVPDSGAASLLLFAPHPALPVTHLPTLATLTTTSGHTDVRMATVRELLVGRLTLRDVPAVVAARDRSEPIEVDGLLPLHLFDRVTVDGPGKRLILEKTQEDDGLMFF
jgi:predicted aspartyl protease